ncbi:Beta-lactamase related protein [Leifsonia rubra CMS 76R]|nr:Beta-lactamase related protein [Leifsonia rubra CMS 76R]
MVEIEKTRERRRDLRAPRAAKHAATGDLPNFTSTFAALGKLGYAGALVSASAVDINTGKTILSIDDRVALPAASIGKILLLIEVAARFDQREFAPYAILDKVPGVSAGAAGLWQHLQAPSLPVADLAALVGATSDNLATNMLLQLVGLDAVRARTESLGLTRTALLDLVRDNRGPDDAPQLSVGSAIELSWLFGALARGEIVNSLASQRVLGWLSLNTDLSLVASAFGLDPLAHRGADHNTLLVNKTGIDRGVRAEAGALRGNKRAVAYAASIQFEDSSLQARLRAIEALRTFGYDLLEYVH